MSKPIYSSSNVVVSACCDAEVLSNGVVGFEAFACGFCSGSLNSDGSVKWDEE